MSRRALPRWTVPALLGAGALLRVLHYLDRESLWGDEAMLALSIVRRSWTGLLQPLDYDQLAPIPFLWAERVMVITGGVSELALRSVPLATGVALLIMLALVARRLLDPLGAVVAPGLAAFSTILIRYSNELKPYSLDALMALLVAWCTIDLIERTDDWSRWVRFGAAGLLAVVVSMPGVFVCCGAVAGVGWELFVRRRPRQLALLAGSGCLWIAAFVAGYRLVYTHVAGADYMRDYWQAGFLTTATPELGLRIALAVKETFMPVADWMVAAAFGIPVLLVSVAGGSAIARRQGAGKAIFLAAPAVAALGASAAGFYPIATRLMIFTAPLLTLLVAAGIVELSSWLHRRIPSVRTAVLAMAFLIPSLEIALRIRAVGPRDEEMRPIVEALRRRASPEPVYIFNRGLPAWAFYTTDWTQPDTARLRWIEQNRETGGIVHENGASRGVRPVGEGAALRAMYTGRLELLGVSSGVRARQWLGYFPESPDSNWAENETRRIRDAARPGIWIVLDNAAQAHEGSSLMMAVHTAGGQTSDSVVAPGVVAYRTTFTSE